MKIGNKEIGPGRAYVIADVGSNFKGSLSLAKEYIDAGASIGLDAVKFQTYRAETLLNRFTPDGEPWAAYDVVGRCELPLEWHEQLFEYAQAAGVEFMTTPFDLEAVDLLVRIGVRAFKVASGDLTFTPLLKKLASTGKPVILSTGAAYLHEVGGALTTLKEGGADVALLHCVSNYPPKYEQVNLRAIETMIKVFGVPVGLSDHTPDAVTALGAVALGASVIEKHITVDKNLGTPDAPFAMTVDEFSRMAADIRKLEAAMGNGIKAPAADEIGERAWARRGIFAVRTLEAGKELVTEDVKFVRPAVGLSAADWPAVMGKRLGKTVEKDSPLLREQMDGY